MSALREEWLRDIAKSGQAYRNEVRAMADELLELRSKCASAPSLTAPEGFVPEAWAAELGRAVLRMTIGNTIEINRGSSDSLVFTRIK